MAPNPDPDTAQRDALDDATAQRLARLGQRKVDVSRLERNLAAALEADAAQAREADDARRRTRFPHWLRPVAGIAAVLAFALTFFLVIGANTPPASAAVVELSQLHRDILSGRVLLTPVDSIADANAWIASQQATAPALPSHLADARVQSCCLADVQGELVAVALLRHGNTTATLVVAEAPDFAHQMGTVVKVDGRTFFGHELNGIRMMMASDGDRWLCVMGEATYNDLAEIAAEVTFGHH